MLPTGGEGGPLIEVAGSSGCFNPNRTNGLRQIRMDLHPSGDRFRRTPPLNRRVEDRRTPRDLGTIAGGGGRIRVCVIVGTRPEVIKMAPVIEELHRHSARFETVIVTTAQHREMLAQALEAFGLTPHVDLGLMATRQSLADFTSRALLALSSCFAELRPDVVLVQGDTTTVLAASLAAHYLGISVGHIEAGLRSGNLRNPFPEELNRRLATTLSDFHFAPTASARDNLLREGVPDDGKGLKRPVREEPVVANGDPKAGDDIPHTEDHQLPYTHHPIPEQRDREPEADQRENDPDEIGHFPEDTQRRFFPHQPWLVFSGGKHRSTGYRRTAPARSEPPPTATVQRGCLTRGQSSTAAS